MQFTTFGFTCFFLVFLVLWHSLKDNITARKIVLIGGSSFFYGVNSLLWLVDLFGIAIFTWVINSCIENSNKQSIKKAWGIFGVSALLIHLVFWKYVPWGVLSWNEIESLPQGWTITPPEWLLPVGLSFFTFHALSLIVPVWVNNYQKFSLLSTIAHISFFPSLLAGPVLRYNDIEPRWKQSWSLKDIDWVSGIGRIMLGMTFKWVFSAKVAEWSDNTFSGMNDNVWDTLGGIHAYTLQIFFDFAGYSHMAIGLAILLGWKLPENFTQPYLSTSIQEFWRNWHRSLSFFFKDNVYILLLGGNRKGKSQTLLNGFLTMLLSGIWHGANLTFVIWGAWHGVLLVIQSLYKMLFKFTLPKFVAWLITFEMVTIGWVWFRATDYDNAIQVFTVLFNLKDYSLDALTMQLSSFVWVAIMSAFTFYEKEMLILLEYVKQKLNEDKSFRITFGGACLLSVWSGLIIFFGPVGVPAFIYNAF